nr:hemin receptor [Prevotella sp.]
MGTKLIIASLAVISLPMNAQETYQDTKFVDNELNGTARYVGMGGAMEALGADISTINTNPAGIGLFRK